MIKKSLKSKTLLKYSVQANINFLKIHIQHGLRIIFLFKHC
jgi:hypothetical protein